MKFRLVMMAFMATILTACGGAATAPAPTTVPAAPAANAPTTAPTTNAPTAAAMTAAPTIAATTGPTTAAATAPTTAPAAGATAAPATSGVETFAIIPEESQVSYEVGEVFINRNNQYAVAIGVTKQISGEIQLDRVAPQNSKVGPITIDISAFQSDSPRRDNAIRDRWLESARFPIATFTPTQIEGLPATHTDGNEITLQITGDLKIRETTKPVTFEVKGSITGDTMQGTATTAIKMSDFGFEAPDILNVLKAEDDVKLNFTFVARPTT